ncbi:S8 family peptidase [bacterium]|nr:S8 family peptidase [bacterium]
MKKLLVVLLLGLVAASMAIAPETKYSDEMTAALATANSNEYIRTYVTLSVQLDDITLANLTYGLSTRAQHNVVVKSWLQETAAAEQSDLLAWLSSHPEMAQRIKPFWISNFVIVDLTPAGIAAVAARNEVVDLHAPSTALVDPSLFVDEPYDADTAVTGYSGGKEIVWGITKTNADDVWALGYDGTGILASIGDTGTRYTHNDMDHNYNASYSHDYEDDDSDPMDSHGHGTHCSGSVLGNGDAGTQTGMAPDATLCANRIYHYCSLSEYEDQMWDHWQDAVSWGLDLISISSGLQQGWGPRNETWRTNARNTLASGVALAVAFGNEDNSTYRTPGAIPEVITVGATDSSDVIAYFSSRGPVTEWDGTFWGGSIIKPDVTAPGVDIKSTSVSGDTSYEYMSGTSMAAPHTAGAIALLLDADDTLTPGQVKTILEQTSVDLGSAGKDNTYGSGRIDVLAAVNEILTPTLRYFTPHDVTVTADGTKGNGDGVIDGGESITIEIELENTGTLNASSVQGVLTCTNSDITITTGTSSFGSVNEGTNATASFAFDVAYAIGANLELHFELAMSGSGFSGQSIDFYQYTSASSDADWVTIENQVKEDGVLLSWTADEGFAGFNVYRALADNRDARIKLNSAILTAGTSGAWLDTAAPGEYLYFVEALEASGEGTFYGPVEVSVSSKNLSVALEDPYPNPASEMVNIELSLANNSAASVVVYDLSGRRVATLVDGQLSAGRHNLTWDSSLAASGVYLVQMQAEGETLNRRVVISR